MQAMALLETNGVLKMPIAIPLHFKGFNMTLRIGDGQVDQNRELPAQSHGESSSAASEFQFMRRVVSFFRIRRTQRANASGVNGLGSRCAVAGRWLDPSPLAGYPDM